MEMRNTLHQLLLLSPNYRKFKNSQVMHFKTLILDGVKSFEQGSAFHSVQIV